MKKYIRLNHYFYNDSISSIETIRPVLIGIDRIRVVTCSETAGSVIWLDNGDNINVLENIETIENLLNTKQR
jgi:hypothetical protein